MKNKIAVQYFSGPFGELILGTYKDAVCLCDWRYRKKREGIDNRIQKGLQAEFVESDNHLLRSLKKDLTDYFTGERMAFALPLIMVGSSFQKSVWEEVRRIPYGQTLSYQELSLKLRNEGAIRAVAAANGANALTILVPCHRIIGSKGELTGYAGGLEVKRKLLLMEGAGKTESEPTLF